MRKIYLEDIPLEQAWQRWISALQAAGRWQPLPGEQVALEQALGRVTAEPVWAAVCSPAYHASAMDGYAVRAADTLGATETAPVRLPIGERARPVNTGDPLPPGADAVIMIEHVQVLAGEIELYASVAPWTNVRPVGEDMVASEMVLPANHVLRPVDLGAAAGSGQAHVCVRRRPRVAIIPTGTELITVEQAAQHGLEPGDIIEYNSIVLAAQVTQWGGLPRRWPIVRDDYEHIKVAILEAAREHDLVLLNAGSSAGSKDYTARVIEDIGTLLVHGVAVRPGHPVILGMIDPPASPHSTQPVNAAGQPAAPNSQSATRDLQSPPPDSPSAIRDLQSAIPMIGVPGYPVSCALTGEIFVEPTLARWLGRLPGRKPSVQARITRKLFSPAGDDEWVRVTVGQVGERLVAAPLGRGAGVITSLARADGIVRIPRFSEGVNAGDEVRVELYSDPSTLANTIVHIGSHDLALDVLAQQLAQAQPGMRLASAHAGSLGGLLALQRGEAHLAGCHLIDPSTGEYNLAYVRQYLPGVRAVLLTLVHRQQGLIVAKGNPRHIQALADLARPDVRYVNRQRGAGTRVLLDYRLGQLGIGAAQVQGYAREEYTHLAVAAAVQSGLADCGLGIAAAAQALDLDFVPLEQERYDLVIPRAFYDSQLLAPLLDIVRGDAFRQAVQTLSGYDTARTGTVVAEVE